MNKVNYNKVMYEHILSFGGEKKKLLLHSCCAPCSTACIERLSSYFDVTIYYYNPNLDTLEEFLLRAGEQQRYCRKLNITCIIEQYEKQDFIDAVNGYEGEKEGGIRCEKCFFLRLKKTAKKCKELCFDYFATTLTISPLKNANLINEIGQKLQEKEGVKYLPTDFKKDNGYLRSVELSGQNGLYRQNYCGCYYSK